MLISKTKKGISSIELVIALFLASTLFNYINKTIISMKNAEVSIQVEENQLCAMEMIYKSLQLNFEYSEVEDLKDYNNAYITNDKLSIDKLKGESISDIFQSDIPEKLPYAKLRLNEFQEGVLLIEFIYVEKNSENVLGSFYKGDYNWK